MIGYVPTKWYVPTLTESVNPDPRKVGLKLMKANSVSLKL